MQEAGELVFKRLKAENTSSVRLGGYQTVGALFGCLPLVITAGIVDPKLFALAVEILNAVNANDRRIYHAVFIKLYP